ncbi:reverse transcriptase (RNA-dependent DNA polymerase) [Hirsutella rhossiliensis]
MDGEPFIADVRVNGTDFVPSLVDYGCLCYGAPRILENAAGDGKEVKIDKITYVSIDLDGHQQHRVFMYVIDDLNWDMILGKRWMEDQDVHIHAKEGYLEIGSNGVQLPPQYHKWSRAFSQQLADQLPPHRPALPWGPLYSMSREELLVLRKTLTELLDKGFIRVSSSPAAAPVLMRDRYPLPLLSETLRTIAKARWFTKVDVIAAFHKIRVAPGDEEKTTFRTRYGSFEWLVVPFGLTGAPAAFQRYINSALQDYLDDFVSAYIDDVLIFSSGSLQDHRDKVGKVLQRLMDAGLQLDINKSEFEVKAVKYLGFIIEAECGIRVDPEKDVYARVLGDSGALTRLTKKDVPFRWDELCEEAFEKLKDLLITAPILHTSIQKGRLSWKQTLQDSPEANYAIHDKELLAILRCLEQWEPELRAVEHFKILTDHKNLRYFYSERRLTERQVRWSEFLSRFQFELEWRPGRKGGLPDALSRRDQDMPANYSDERLKGRIMRLFQNDHLRRVPISTLSTNTEGAQEINFGKEIRIFEDEELQQLWHAARQEDKLYQELTKLVADGAKSLPTGLQKEKVVSISECSLDNRGLLCFRERVWIPGSEPLRTKIIQETHDSHITGHPGRDLTYSTLSRRFFWPGAASDVRRFVRNCEVCGRNTIWRDTKKGLLKPLPIPQRIWSEITIDFITDLPPSGKDGATNCMVVTDRLTKGVELEGLHDISSEAVARRLFERHYPVHGIPTAITSDRGPQFVSGMWKHFCQLLGIEQRLSTAYHPQTDGATERMNQEVERILRIWTNYLQENWLDLLPVAMATINERKQPPPD